MTAYHDTPYLDLMIKILRDGTHKGDRTGTGTISLPFQQMRFDLSDNKLPLLTTKKVFTKGIIHELLWFLDGDTNIKYLVDNGVNIWNEWPHAAYVKQTGEDVSLGEFIRRVREDDVFAQKWGDLGPVYGYQWRSWPKVESMVFDIESDTPMMAPVMTGVDQIATIIDQLRTDPNNRRIILSAWNVAQLDKMKLPPCHAFVQFWSDGEELRCHLYQRSADFFLGVPFNIAQYSMLTFMIAHVTGLKATEFVWTGGDVHIYNNHIEQCHDQLSRVPFQSPSFHLNPDVKEIDDFTFDDFHIEGYECHPAIKAPVSV